jgi:threonylcarbamoyladenosine tRNA methylthiotransferase MtaB
MAEILAEISSLHGRGFREIILTGINIGLYDGGAEALLQGILEGSSMTRVRISSIEPWTVSGTLVELMAREPRICRHFHLPLQSGSDTVLRRMGRPYGADYYRGLVERVRGACPDAALGADVMVGFPGEGEEEFRATESLVEGLDISYLHVFPYSRRPGTPAADFDGAVDPRVARDRACSLRNISHAKRGAFIASRVGRGEEAIVTNAHGDFFRGVTSNYIKVEAPGDARVNDLVKVVLTEACDGYARAVPRTAWDRDAGGRADG